MNIVVYMGWIGVTKMPENIRNLQYVKSSSSRFL